MKMITGIKGWYKRHEVTSPAGFRLHYPDGSSKQLLHVEEAV
jgi:hypothetical protein